MRFLLLSFILGSALAAPPVPRPASPLEIVDSSGKHLLSSCKGKVVVVQFLLTTCSHCQAFSQMLNKFQLEYGPRGFQALGAAVNEATPEMAREYATNYAPAFPVGPMIRESVLTFMGMSIMDRPGFPQIAVIDRKGRIREQTSSDMTQPQQLYNDAYIRPLIEKLLAEVPVSGTPKKVRSTD